LNKIKPESFGDFDRVLRDFLPYLHLNSDQVPEIMNWEPDNNYRLVIDIRQNSKNVEPSKRTMADFTIIGYKVVEPKDIENMTDAEFGDYQGEKLDEVSKSNESSLSANLDR